MIYMTLKKLVHDKRPREKSGSRSSNRFDFQKEWALCKLFELHRTQGDYLLVMDYHEDVLLLNSEETPTEISFYQLKSKDPGIWKLNDLIKRKKGANGPLTSIVGKLYNCKLIFGKHTLSLTLISNARFEVELEKDGEKSSNKKIIPFSNIKKNQLSTIIKSIKEEHSLLNDPEFVDITFLEVTDLNIRDREPYMIGKLHQFLTELSPKGKFRVDFIYGKLFNEIKRKNDYEWDLDSFEEVKKYKSISRSEFENMLKQFDIDNRCDKAWESIEKKLNADGTDFRVILNLQGTWRDYEIDKMDYSNQHLQDIKKAISSLLEPYKNHPTRNLYEDVVEPIYKEFLIQQPICIYGEYYIKVMILMEYCGL
jgi:sporulation protein YlmC with PRC-barrel domain